MSFKFVVTLLNLVGKRKLVQNVKVLEEAGLPAVSVSRETASKQTFEVSLFILWYTYKKWLTLMTWRICKVLRCHESRGKSQLGDFNWNNGSVQCGSLLSFSWSNTSRMSDNDIEYERYWASKIQQIVSRNGVTDCGMINFGFGDLGYQPLYRE